MPAPATESATARCRGGLLNLLFATSVIVHAAFGSRARTPSFDHLVGACEEFTRLITNSYLVGACTGMSAGFPPLRMRSTYPATCRTTSCELGPFCQKQTFAVHQPMSALPPKADMCGATRDVRYGPKADIVLSAVSMWLDARHQNGLAGHLKPRAPFIRSERFDQFFHNPLAHFRFLKLNN
jgi:hypothetical protein